MADADRVAATNRNLRTVSERDVPESNLVQFFDVSVALRPKKRIRPVESVWQDLREVLQRVPGITPERIEDVCASLYRPDFTDTSEEHDPSASLRAFDFGALPVDVVVNISRFCDAQSLCAFRETCRATHKAISSPSAVVVWEKAAVELRSELERASRRSDHLQPKVQAYLTGEFSILLPRDIRQIIRKAMEEKVVGNPEKNKRAAISIVFDKISHCTRMVCARVERLVDDGRLQNDVNNVFDSARMITTMALSFTVNKFYLSHEQVYYAMGKLLRVNGILLQKVFMRRNVRADPSARMTFSTYILKAMEGLPIVAHAIDELCYYVDRVRSESEVCDYEFPFDCHVTDKPIQPVDGQDFIFESGITVAIAVKNGWYPLETFLDCIPNDETVCYRNMGGGVTWRADLGCVLEKASDVIKVMTKEPRNVRRYRVHVLREEFVQSKGSSGSRDARSAIAYRKYVECFGDGAEEYFARRDFGEKHRLTIPQCFALALAQASDPFDVKSRRVFSTVRIADDFCSLVSTSSPQLLGPEERTYDANTSAQMLLLTVLAASHTRVKSDWPGETLNSHIVITLLDRLHHARLCGSELFTYPTYDREECGFTTAAPPHQQRVLGVSTGDRLSTSRGCCTVIGYRDNMLWVQYDDGYAATCSGILRSQAYDFKVGVLRMFETTGEDCKATISPNAFCEIAHALSHYAKYAGKKKKTGDGCEEDPEEKSSPSQHMSDFDMAALAEVDKLGDIACNVDDCYFACPLFLRLSRQVSHAVPEDFKGYMPGRLMKDTRDPRDCCSLTPNEWFVEWASIPDPEKRRRSWLPAMLWIAASTALLERNVEHMAALLSTNGAPLNMRVAFAYMVIDALPLDKDDVEIDGWDHFEYVVSVRVALWRLIADCDEATSEKECEKFSALAQNAIETSYSSALGKSEFRWIRWMYCAACVGVKVMNAECPGSLATYNIEAVATALRSISWDLREGMMEGIPIDPTIFGELVQCQQMPMCVDPDTGLVFNRSGGANLSEKSYVRKEMGYAARDIYALGNLLIDALFPFRRRYLGGKDDGAPESANRILSAARGGLSRLTNDVMSWHAHDHDIRLFVDRVVNKAIEVGGTPSGFRDLLTDDECGEWTLFVRELYRFMFFFDSDTTVDGVVRSSYTFKWTYLYAMACQQATMKDAIDWKISHFLRSDTETHLEIDGSYMGPYCKIILQKLGMDIGPFVEEGSIALVSNAAPLQVRISSLRENPIVVIDKLTNAPYEAYVAEFSESYKHFLQFASVFIPEL